VVTDPTITASSSRVDVDDDDKALRTEPEVLLSQSAARRIDSKLLKSTVSTGRSSTSRVSGALLPEVVFGDDVSVSRRAAAAASRGKKAYYRKSRIATPRTNVTRQREQAEIKEQKTDVNSSSASLDNDN
jgi:hypothetical protein